MAELLQTMPYDRDTIALALFDQTSAVHHLRQQHRKLLQYAAQIYGYAVERGERPIRAGRDLALALPFAGLDAEERCLIASIVAFQADRIKREQELAFLRLDDHDQRSALALAAILSLADALAAHTHELVAHINDPDQVIIVVGGPNAEAAVAAASERDWRWYEAIGPLQVRSIEEDASLDVPAIDFAPLAPLAEPTALEPGEEPLAENARRLLRRQFEKMLGREADVRGGEDIEDVHQMRVATRRLRASLQVIAPVFEPELIKNFRRRLRSVAETLGIVRDADVFLEHIRAYRDTLSAARKPSLDQLIAAVEAERSVARVALLEALDSKRYRTFKHAFARFLTTPEDGVLLHTDYGGPLRIRDMAGSMIWRRFEDLRSFEVVIDGAPDPLLHQARIAGKRLRYTLEFLSSVLGDKVDACLDPLAELQEALGGLQDGVVARERIEQLGLANTPGPRSYLARREAEHTRLLRQLPRRWSRIVGPAYRRKLLELIATL